jgi:hypothetical protein
MGFFAPSDETLAAALNAQTPGVRWHILRHFNYITVHKGIGWAPGLTPELARVLARQAWEPVSTRYGLRLKKNTHHVLCVSIQASDGRYYGVTCNGDDYGPEGGLAMF